MKKNIISSIVGLLIISGFIACSGKGEDPAVAEVQSYVDSVTGINKDYTDANWTMINAGYEMRVEKAEKAELSAEEKTKLADSKKKYTDLKVKYEEEVVKNKPAPVIVELTWKQKLRNNLFGEGKIGTDMNFNFVTADNILDTYTKFVDVVADHKKEYSREDWDEVKLLYEALDTRKNAVEKEGLKSSDNLNIAKQKVRFSTIYTIHRPLSKMKENEKAKE